MINTDEMLKNSEKTVSGFIESNMLLIQRIHTLQARSSLYNIFIYHYYFFLTNYVIHCHIHPSRLKGVKRVDFPLKFNMS